MTTMDIGQKSLERVILLCRNTILSKIFAGAGYGISYLSKPAAIADKELNTPQCLLLALLNSLVNEEVMSCCMVADVCSQVQQSQSDYLRAWLIGEFDFPHQDMVKAMALLSNLLATGVLELPSHVIGIIMSSIVTKYGIQFVQFIPPSMEGGRDLAHQLENSVPNNSPRDTTLVTGGPDINRLTQSGDSLLHLAVSACSSVNLEVVDSRYATTLEDAVKKNCVPSVKSLLMAGAKVGKRLFRGDTYLHIAADGHNGALEALLEAGMDVNDKNNLGETPLLRAVREGNVCGVGMLLAKGADASIVPDGGKSVAEVVLESQNVEMLKEFVKGRALSDLKFNDGDTILHRVVRSENTEMLEAIKVRWLTGNSKFQNGDAPSNVNSETPGVGKLVGIGRDIDERTKKGETALYLAAAKGSLEMVKALIEEGAAVDAQDSQGGTPLMIVLKNSREDIARLLLHNGANPRIRDKDGQTPIHYAARGVSIGLVTNLLDAGARANDENNSGATALEIALHNSKEDIAILLFRYGANPTIKAQGGLLSRNLLHYAVKGGFIGLVTTLLEGGARIDDMDHFSNTPAFIAVINNQSNILKLLVERGADLTIRDWRGNGIIHREATAGHAEVVKVLLNAGVPVDTRGRQQQTALHCAAREGHAEVVTVLLTHRADLEVMEENNWTPLMEASHKGNLGVVKQLVDWGADVNKRSGDGITARSIAERQRKRAVADYLMSKGGLH